MTRAPPRRQGRRKCSSVRRGPAHGQQRGVQRRRAEPQTQATALVGRQDQHGQRCLRRHQQLEVERVHRVRAGEDLVGRHAAARGDRDDLADRMFARFAADVADDAAAAEHVEGHFARCHTVPLPRRRPVVAIFQGDPTIPRALDRQRQLEQRDSADEVRHFGVVLAPALRRGQQGPPHAHRAGPGHGGCETAQVDAQRHRGGQRLACVHRCDRRRFARDRDGPVRGAGGSGQIGAGACGDSVPAGWSRRGLGPAGHRHRHDGRHQPDRECRDPGPVAVQGRVGHRDTIAPMRARCAARAGARPACCASTRKWCSLRPAARRSSSASRS